jgi:prepilin-type processing-associated H-X9-DG protein
MSVKGEVRTLMTKILPDMEMTPLYQKSKNSYANNVVSGGLGNRAIRGQLVAAYLCPTDSSVADGILSPDWTLASYSHNFQAFAPNDGTASMNSNRNKSVKMRDFTNGTSNTILFSESLQRCGPNGAIWSHGDWNVDWMASFGGGGARSLMGSNSQPTSHAKSSTCNPDRPAGSMHTGGAQVLLGDGSVRFVSETVSGTVWWATCTKNSGEVGTIVSD